MKKLLFLVSICCAFQAQAAFDGEFLNELTKQGQNLTAQEKKQFVKELVESEFSKNTLTKGAYDVQDLTDIFCDYLEFFKLHAANQDVAQLQKRLFDGCADKDLESIHFALNPMKAELIKIALKNREAIIAAANATVDEKIKADMLAKKSLPSGLELMNLRERTIASAINMWADTNPEIERECLAEIERLAKIARLEESKRRESQAQAQSVQVRNERSEVYNYSESNGPNISRLYHDHKSQNRADKRNDTMEKRNRRNGDDY